MKRKKLVRLHILTTIVAALTISTFFAASLYAEISENVEIIKQVKLIIIKALPIMIIAMPTLNITGNKLVGKSQNPIVLLKKKRMKFVIINGIILFLLAIFLYYYSHYRTIDSIFFSAQIAEFIFGLTNLTLIGLNAKSGFQLSNRPKRKTKKSEV